MAHYLSHKSPTHANLLFVHSFLSTVRVREIHWASLAACIRVQSQGRINKLLLSCLVLSQRALTDSRSELTAPKGAEGLYVRQSRLQFSSGKCQDLWPFGDNITMLVNQQSMFHYLAEIHKRISQVRSRKDITVHEVCVIFCDGKCLSLALLQVILKTRQHVCGKARTFSVAINKRLLLWPPSGSSLIGSLRTVVSPAEARRICNKYFLRQVTFLRAYPFDRTSLFVTESSPRASGK